MFQVTTGRNIRFVTPDFFKVEIRDQKWLVVNVLFCGLILLSSWHWIRPRIKIEILPCIQSWHVSIKTIVVSNETGLKLCYFLLSLYWSSIIPRILLIDGCGRPFLSIAWRINFIVRVAHLVSHLISWIITLKVLNVTINGLLSKYARLVVLIVIYLLTIMRLLQLLLIKLHF